MENVKLATWVAQNWDTVLLLILVADKIVAITPTPYDDLILTVIKGVLKPFSALLSNKIEEEKINEEKKEE
jgi:hypothetical protein